LSNLVAAVNIAPDLMAKRDITQNAIEVETGSIANGRNEPSLVF
jgi:hypothetical protein